MVAYLPPSIGYVSACLFLYPLCYPADCSYACHSDEASTSCCLNESSCRRRLVTAGQYLDFCDLDKGTSKHARLADAMLDSLTRLSVRDPNVPFLKYLCIHSPSPVSPDGQF